MLTAVELGDEALGLVLELGVVVSELFDDATVARGTANRSR